MDTEIIIAVVATGIAGLAIVVTLCLAVLSGFRWLYDKIDSIAKELREDIAENTAAIAGLDSRVAGLEGRMTVIETMLKTILQAVLPGSGNATANPPADADTPQSETERMEHRSLPHDLSADATAPQTTAPQTGEKPDQRIATTVIGSGTGR